MTWMKKLTAGLVLAVAIVGGSCSAPAQKITTFDPTGAGTGPGQGTYAQQGLNSGTIVGYYVDANNVAHGFIRSVNGNYTTIDVPGAVGTQAFGINNKGTVVGWWFEPNNVDSCPSTGICYHGYLRDKDGNFTYFDVPGAAPYQPPASSPPLVVIPLPLSINLSGTVTGSYVDGGGMPHCFVRSVDGTITNLHDPDGGVSSIGDTNGINKEGAISGGYNTADGVIHGFVRDPDGTVTTFDGPGAGNIMNYGSVGESINDAGTIPGVSQDNNGVYHAWIRYSDGTFVPPFDVTGAGTGLLQGTLALATNLAGDTAGIYYDVNGAGHGFVRSKQGKITKFDVSGQGAGSGQGLTATNSINAGGAVVGWYVDSNGAFHGFIYK